MIFFIFSSAASRSHSGASGFAPVSTAAAGSELASSAKTVAVSALAFLAVNNKLKCDTRRALVEIGIRGA